MIRLSDELKNYPRIDLQTLEGRGENIPEDIKNSIVLYNKALDQLRVNSEDIAIIELKKAISLNPHFYEAMNLLGLCYSLSKENGKAVEVFNRVIEAEKNSVKALEYLKLLDVGSGSRQLLKQPAKTEDKVEKKSHHVAEVAKSIKVDISREDIIKILSGGWLKYGIGILIGALMVFLIQLPFNGRDKTLYTSNQIDIPAADVKTPDEFEEKYNQLSADYEKIQNELKQASTELDYYKNSQKIPEAEKLFEDRKYEEAADVLVQLREYGFKDSEKEKVSSIVEKAVPRATWEVYVKGRDAFNNKNYAEAASKLAKVQIYGGSWEYVPDALYKLVLSYVELNDKAKAAEALNSMKGKYPDSEYTRDAESRVSQM